MKQNRMNIRSILRMAGMLVTVTTLAFGVSSCGSDGDGGGGSIPINAPSAAEIGWPSSSQPVINGLNGLFDAIDPTTTEEQREALEDLSDVLNNAGMNPESYIPVVALATMVEDPTQYGDDYFAAIKTNLSAYSGTLQLDPATNTWIYTPGAPGAPLEIRYQNPDGQDCKVTIDRSGSTGTLHTKVYDINQETLDLFAARGFDINRLGLSAEQMAEIAAGKSIRLSLEMPTHATTKFVVGGSEVMSTTMDIATLVMNDGVSASKKRRAPNFNYYAMIDQMDITGSVFFGPYSIVLARCQKQNGKLGFDLRLNQGNSLLLGVGMDQKWNANHFTSLADMVPITSVSTINMLNATTLRIEMVENKREDIVQLVKVIEKALGSTSTTDDEDEFELTPDMAVMILNTYFDIAFYTPDMSTRLGQVFFKNEMVTDEDGDIDEDFVPYIRTSDGKEHPLVETIAAKLNQEEVQAKLGMFLQTLLNNSLLEQLMDDPFFGITVNAVNFVPGQPVDWTVGE